MRAHLSRGLILAAALSVVPFAAARGEGPGGEAGTREVAVLAGGCFWGMEAIFDRLDGVVDVVSGFAGGSSWKAHYALVSLGITDHAESVRITYDPRRITFRQLLDVYFLVAHDPTQFNRQGPDQGRQYRSSIFYLGEDQRAAAVASVEQLEGDQVFGRPIVTTIVPFAGFYPAGPEHQDFLDRHPTHAYIVANDLPKLEELKARFPDLVKRR
ncbi:MAG: peptide-methionine (S)-S-oxide reductase MsrA [Gemmatimonadetes bacterium]|nr:peptide-methionine (S)-S-oxide reductase MsrA [Gemmatimonadota bacterium]